MKIGLYLHVPFCTNKCGYCDFNSWGETRRAPQDVWLAAIDRQISFWFDHWRERGLEVEVETVFFGGGTPSLLEAPVLEKLGQRLRSIPNFSPVEFTAECNPETLDAAKLASLRELGVTRLSVGIQSFDDRYLERLERQARRVDNIRALDLVASEWSGPWSLDLMFALPDQTVEHWATTLDEALRFAPGHLSAYQLTLTTARSLAWRQAGENELLEFFDRTEEHLAAAGLGRYEVSNFAKPGAECRHNLKYWRLEPFLGVGPGASGLLPASLLGTESGSHGAHQKNPSGFEAWAAGAGNAISERSWFEARAAGDHLFELLMMGLRLDSGLGKHRLGALADPMSELFKAPEFLPYFEDLEEGWRATPKGLRILDSLLPRLYGKIENFLGNSLGANLDSQRFDPMFSVRNSI